MTLPQFLFDFGGSRNGDFGAFSSPSGEHPIDANFLDHPSILQQIGLTLRQFNQIVFKMLFLLFEFIIVVHCYQCF